MKNRIIIGTVLLSAGLAFPVPSWMWIGTTAIDDHLQTGGPDIPRPSAQTLVNSFYDKAVEHIPAGGPTPYRNMNLVNSGVTKANLQTGSQRPMSDILIFGDVASPVQAGVPFPSLFLGDGAAYGSLANNAWTLGGSYERWAIFIGEAMFQNSGYYHWDPLFRGLQAAMGFQIVSNPVTHWTSADYANYLGYWFWRNWTVSNNTLWESWRDGVIAASYLTGVNSTINLYSSQSPTDWHYYGDDTWTSASSQKARDEAWRIYTHQF